MSEATSHATVEMGSERSFGMVFAAIFAIIGLWPLLAGSGDIRFWALAIGAAFLIVGLLLPKLLGPLNLLWFKFGELLGRIIAPLIMALVFFVVVTPTGLIVRALGHDLLRQKLDPDAESYWIERDTEMASMKNQF